jgi:hypothetical protein
MKRFVLNKINIAKLADLHIIKGGVDTPNEISVIIGECSDLATDGCATGGTMPCTLTSSASELTSDPIGTDTLPL